MKYAWIKGQGAEFPTTSMCRFMGVSKSAYYCWLRRCPTAREKADAELAAIIQGIFTKSRGTYGTRRIRYSLLRQNLSAGRRRIGRLMRDADLVCRTQRKFKATTNSNHGLPVADNLLDRQEYDHADIFPDLDAIKKQFHHLVRTVPSEGLIISPACEKNISGSLS